MKYTYKLHQTEPKEKNLYSRQELERLTTLQLREICQQEKIVIGVAYRLDREHLMKTILKYRGKKQYDAITTATEEGNEKIFLKLKSYLRFETIEKEVQLPLQMTLFLDKKLTVENKCFLETKQHYGRNALLLDGEYNVCGVLQLQKAEQGEWLLSNPLLLRQDMPEALYKTFRIGFLEAETSRALYQYYTGEVPLRPIQYTCFVKTIGEMRIARTQPTNTTLVIDFGTSNTTAGAFLEEKKYPAYLHQELEKTGIVFGKTNLVHFCTEDGTPQQSIPTVLGIKHCANAEQIQYYYGWEAEQAMAQQRYGGKASIFYDLKKWVNGYDVVEEIYDSEGNCAFVPRWMLLRQYFLYIIGEAEQQHKCKYTTLHITSPIRQKQQFLALYQQILQEYHVMTETALDEGVAVLYSSISKQIAEKQFLSGESYHALVIDCGGGTTDLTSCKYTITETPIVYQLDFKTIYANGNNYFGGNTLTYRVFQYLKVLFAEEYRGETVSRAEELLPWDSTEVYQVIDTKGIAGYYKKLEEAAAEAEQWLPTKYALYQKQETEQYYKVKSNFYFLWQLAEQVKVSFYEQAGVLHTVFHKQGIRKKEGTQRQIGEESWRLNLLQKDGNFQLVTTLPKRVVTKEEINLLLQGEIYYNMKRFLEPLYEKDALGDYTMIKLTGQTCKIPLFREVLKEYIPGKMIAMTRQKHMLQQYKLNCVEGAIQYENAKKIGLIAPHIIDEVPMTPYALTALTYQGKEVVLISYFERINQSYGFVSRTIGTEMVSFFLKNQEGTTLHTYTMALQWENFPETTYEEIRTVYGEKILQEDIDTIVEQEMKLFAFSYGDRWGFYILPIGRKGGTLRWGEKSYFPFEQEQDRRHFFDGMQ